MNWPKDVVRSVLRLGAGETIARLASFALVAYISRRYGLELLGAFALAQTVATYATQGADLGFRLIGARIVARDPNLARMVVPLVTKRRGTAGLICVCAGLAYAIWGPMPGYARLCVGGFAVGLLPYALSLDWLAWGLSYFGWLGCWRAGVAVILSAGSLLAFQFFPDPRTSLAFANFAANATGLSVLWLMWHRSWKYPLRSSPSVPKGVAGELAWAPAFTLGLAVLVTQVFHNFDTLILGAMAPLSEVGRYNSAYRILFLICAAYYLVTQSIYPRLAASTGGATIRTQVYTALSLAAAAGSVVAAMLWAMARPILAVIYGSDLGATHLLRILVLAVPMDFVAALLGVCFVSRGFERFMLLACGSAALCNLACNLVLIPRMGAQGAAVATLASYLLLVSILLVGFIVKPIFKESPVARESLAERIGEDLMQD